MGKIVILSISGGNKADIFRKIMEDTITTDIPASLLQVHPDVTVLVDQKAA
jgi:glucosamine-6-phosphate deaminase